MSGSGDTILYDPNLDQILNVKVLGLVIAASHDKGSAGGDQRHMIDLYCLKMLDSGEQLLNSMIPAVPRYTQVGGRDIEGQKVLGMINCPLKARCDRESRFVHVILDEVLVVDRLPVPLHISIQRLEADFTPGLKTLTSYNSAEDAENFLLKRQNLPEHYHSHPFFKGDGPMPDKPTVVAHTEVASSSSSSSSSPPFPPPPQTAPFVNCGLASCVVVADKDQRLLVCSQCRRIAYCCPEHQAQDWKRHRAEDNCKKASSGK